MIDPVVTIQNNKLAMRVVLWMYLEAPAVVFLPTPQFTILHSQPLATSAQIKKTG